MNVLYVHWKLLFGYSLRLPSSLLLRPESYGTWCALVFISQCFWTQRKHGAWRTGWLTSYRRRRVFTLGLLSRLTRTLWIIVILCRVVEFQLYHGQLRLWWRKPPESPAPKVWRGRSVRVSSARCSEAVLCGWVRSGCRDGRGSQFWSTWWCSLGPRVQGLGLHLVGFRVSPQLGAYINDLLAVVPSRLGVIRCLLSFLLGHLPAVHAAGRHLHAKQPCSPIAWLGHDFPHCHPFRLFAQQRLLDGQQIVRLQIQL